MNTFDFFYERMMLTSVGIRICMLIRIRIIVLYFHLNARTNIMGIGIKQFYLHIA